MGRSTSSCSSAPKRARASRPAPPPSPEGEHAIDVVVGGYYTGGDGGQIDVGGDEGSVSLNGDYTASNGAGTRAADDGSKTKVDLNIRFKGTKQAKEILKGNVSVRFESGGASYELESDTLEALGVDEGGAASLRAAATLTDVTKKTGGAVVTGLTLVLTFSEEGKHGTVGITVWNGSTLVFSSDWTGSSTRERALEHGTVHVK